MIPLMIYGLWSTGDVVVKLDGVETVYEVDYVGQNILVSSESAEDAELFSMFVGENDDMPSWMTGRAGWTSWYCSSGSGYEGLPQTQVLECLVPADVVIEVSELI